MNLLTIPNDENAKVFVKTLRDAGFSVRLRGRGYRFGQASGVGSDKYQNSIPISIAKKVAVYISGTKINDLYAEIAMYRLAALKATIELNQLKSRVKEFVQTV